MTVCNVKGVACRDEPTIATSAVSLSSKELFSVFQLIVLFFYGPASPLSSTPFQAAEDGQTDS